ARELGDVLALGVRGLKGADADAVFLRKDYALDENVLHPAAVSILNHDPAGGAEAPLDGNAQLRPDSRTQIRWHQVQGLLVHGTALDGVERTGFGAAVGFKTPLGQGYDGGFAAADRTHEEQDPLAHIQPAGGRVEVFFHQALQGLVQPKQVVGKKSVALAAVHFFHAVGDDHVIDAGVGVLSDAGVLPH